MHAMIPLGATFELAYCTPGQLSTLCGRYNEHLHQIESTLSVHIINRGNRFHITGIQQERIEQARMVLYDLYQQLQQHVQQHEGCKHSISREDVYLLLHAQVPVMQQHGKREVKPCAKKNSMQVMQDPSTTNMKYDASNSSIDTDQNTIIKTPKKHIKLVRSAQISLIASIEKHPVTFAIGPAGTGKTYIAVASAVDQLMRERVSKILLVRPVVEAGEKLGFLPGDLTEKVDPYLRPVYDALHEFLGFERVAQLISKNVIEIAPLAFMRGRTLNHTLVILDEAQNTTPVQMKMFLTRIGFNTRMVITGDLTQIDLPAQSTSGLVHAKSVLQDIQGIHFVFFAEKDIVRHAIIQDIITAYQRDGQF